jgi:hypothetical protein
VDHRVLSSLNCYVTSPYGAVYAAKSVFPCLCSQLQELGPATIYILLGSSNVVYEASGIIGIMSSKFQVLTYCIPFIVGAFILVLARDFPPRLLVCFLGIIER